MTLAKLTLRAGLGALAATLIANAGMAQTKIVLAHSQQNITPSFAIGSSLPTELKFWAKEGIEVDVVPTPGAAAAIQLLIAGKADVALANPSSAMAAIQRGAPIKVVYTATRGDIFGVALPKGVALSDLKGKVVGVSSFASGSNNYARTLLRDAGLEPGKDVSVVEIGTGARAAAAFQSGQVQAVSLWDEQYQLLAENGLTFPTLIKDPRAADFVSGSLVVRTEDIAKRRDILIGIARGIAKAQLFQEKYANETIKLHWKTYPASAPRKVDAAAVDAAVRVLESRKAIQARDVYGTGKFGDIPLSRFAKFQDYLIMTGELPKAIEVSNYITNELIGDINKFDDAEVYSHVKDIPQ